MPKANNKFLDTGDMFPRLEMSQIGGEKIVLPNDLLGKWGVVLFYSGHWWTLCLQQLKAYSSTSKMKEEGIEVVAASVDTEELAQKTVKECNDTFPMAHGLDPEFISEVTGAFYQKDPGKRERPYLHATNFILEPDGKVNVSVYSSGPAGRLACQDMLHHVQKQKERVAAETK